MKALIKWLAAPMLRHQVAVGTLGFTGGALAQSIAGDTHIGSLVLGLLAGLGLAMATMVAVWEYQDTQDARRKRTRPVKRT